MIIRPEAEVDLASARDWYERQRGGFGDAFLMAVEEAFERIQRTPESYALVHRDVRRAFTRRFLYFVYYRIQGGEVTVVGLVHSGRAPYQLQSRD